MRDKITKTPNSFRRFFVEYFELGASRLKASRLALGTWAFSGARIWGSNPEEDSVRTIHMALDHGINLFDTANRYGDGEAERVLGEALKGRRSEALIATKLYTDELAYDSVITSCEKSLKRLQTDCIDLYQIHWPSRTVPLEETFRAFEKLKEQGKIRETGVCNFGELDAPQAAACGAALDQLPYSLVWRVIEKKILPACRKAGLPVWAYVPLGQGLLSGKYRSIEDVPMGRRETRIYSSAWGMSKHTEPGFEEPVFALIGKLAGLCEEYGCSMAELALAFLKNSPDISAVLMGARSERQLKQNLSAWEAHVPPEAVRKAKALSEALKDAEGENADLWISEDGGRMR